MKRILFVDDEHVIAYCADRVLRRAGYDVRVFQDGREALSAMCGEPGSIDLVVTDQTMPSMTGIELLIGIRKVAPAVPAVLISGAVDELDPEMLADLDVRACLGKPFTREELVRCVADALGE